MTEPLSPAAEAVLDALKKEWVASQMQWSSPSSLAGLGAAALRAAADQARSQKITRSDWTKQTWVLQSDILAIADELEGAE